jgi:hypothetical protein
VGVSLDPASEDDRKIAAEFSVYWMNAVKRSLAAPQDSQVSFNIPRLSLQILPNLP